MKKLERSYIRQILDAINERTISFAGGLPNENLFPVKDLKVATNKVLENPLCLQYSKSQGVEGLREKLQTFIQINLTFRQIKMKS